MKSKLFTLATAAFLTTLPTFAQQPEAAPLSGSLADWQAIEEKPSPEIAPSAVQAVRALGQEMLKGNYQAAFRSMNPMWKKRLASRMGSTEKLEQELDKGAKTLLANGVALTSFEPSNDTQVLEVWPDQKPGSSKQFVYKKWLVIIPTTTRFRLTNQGQTHIIESHSFQIAIADKNQLNWSFIDGSSVNINDLRSIFLTLPESLKLPKTSRSVIQ